VGLFIILSLLGRGSNRVESAAILAFFSLVLYIPGGYYLEMFMYRRRLAKRQQGSGK
jgi:hypothetical protein